MHFQLTHKKLMFVVGIKKGMNKKDAAIFAGCPKHSAKQQAQRLFKDSQVQHYLKSELAPDDLKQLFSINADSPKDLLLNAMNNKHIDTATRIEVAAALLPYYHSKYV